ncbi:MAG: gliding motility-associated C-terminal domain-containing protein [Bacteroidetes bacterium]|nr:gliding motility-associated C-terminal domain-containing protein [Bacteroidota bacterium]
MKTIYAKGWKLLACLIIAFIQMSTEAYASHAQGGELTYTCLGGNQYRLRLAFYRDCSGVSAPGTVSIDINSATCNQSFTTVLTPIAGTGQDVTPICPSQTTVCSGGPNPGVQQWIYEGVITLPQQCTDWVFSFTLCCRNAAINTITNPGGQNIYIESHLNNVAAPCNSSPTFSNIPVPYICSGQSFCFNHGAIDPDGDSLSYTLVNPGTGPGTYVTYINPYTSAQPLLSNPAVTFNPVTGDICMNPTQIIVTVMAVRVDEWRNAVNIGSVTRDIELHTVNCTNSLPYITGINNTGVYSMSSCAGNNINFSINSFDSDPGQNITMTWNNGITGASFTTTGGPLPTGTFSWTPSAAQISNNPYCFTVTVTDDACPYFGSQTFAFCITVTGFAMNITSTAANCNASNGTASVIVTSGTGPFTYSWSSGGNNANQNGLSAGTYSVTVTDAAGCVAMDTVTVGQGAAPGNLVMSQIDVLCYNTTNGSATANMNGGQQPYTYSWSNGGNTSTISNLTAGTYTVTVTTNNGCTATGTVTLTQPASALATSSTVMNNVSCFGGNNGLAYVNASGGTGPYVYSWNSTPAQNTANANSLSAGIYSCVVTDANGCTSTLNVNITEPPVITSTVTSTSVSCNGGSNGAAQIILSGGTFPYSISWNCTPSQSGTFANNLSSGNYTATVTDANGCVINAPAAVSQPAPLAASLSSLNNVSCNGASDGNAGVNVNGGTSPYVYSWNTTPAQFTPAAANIPAGNYTITVTDANGCATVSTVSITQPAPVNITAFSNDTICPGQPAVIAAGASGGTGPYSYVWNNNLGNNSTYTVYPSTLTTYIVHAVDANGCASASASITIDVFQFSPANLVMSGNAALCSGTTTIIGATVTGNTGALNWTWSNQTWTNGGPFTVQPNATTNYILTITNQCGTVVNGSVTVVVHPVPVISLSPQLATGCDEVPLTFTDTTSANTNCSYTWNFGDNNTGTGNGVVHNYTIGGIYTVTATATSVYGCVGTGSTNVNVTIFDSPRAAFAMDAHEVSELEPTIHFTNESSVNTLGWQWDFGDNTTDNIPSPTHTYAAIGSYTARLIATSNGGCTDTTMQRVEVNPEFTLYIPNAFTPNGDGLNDNFLAYGNEVSDFHMMMFDRWGEMIYETSDMNAGWDGTARGGKEISQEGVYVYKIMVTDFRGKKHSYTGHVSLLK